MSSRAREHMGSRKRRRENGGTLSRARPMSVCICPGEAQCTLTRRSLTEVRVKLAPQRCGCNECLSRGWRQLGGATKAHALHVQGGCFAYPRGAPSQRLWTNEAAEPARKWTAMNGGPVRPATRFRRQVLLSALLNSVEFEFYTRCSAIVWALLPHWLGGGKGAAGLEAPSTP